MKTAKLILVVIFTLIFSVLRLEAKPTFTTILDIALPYQNNANKDISIDPVEYIITPEDYEKKGAIWCEQPLDFTNDFVIKYEANFGRFRNDKNGIDIGADGLVFIIAETKSIGLMGQSIGYGDLGTIRKNKDNNTNDPTKNITPSFAVEFDTYYNEFATDDFVYSTTQDDHIALINNGDQVNNIKTTDVINLTNIEDGRYHCVKITWNHLSKVITVYFDDVKRITKVIDIPNVIFPNSNNPKYWGITGATESAINLQKVRNLKVNTGSNLFTSNSSLYDVDVFVDDNSLYGKCGRNDFEPCIGTNFKIKAFNVSEIGSITSVKWFADNIEITGTNNSLSVDVTLSGSTTYKVEITYSNGVVITDELYIKAKNTTLSSSLVLSLTMSDGIADTKYICPNKEYTINVTPTAGFGWFGWYRIDDNGIDKYQGTLPATPEKSYITNVFPFSTLDNITINCPKGFNNAKFIVWGKYSDDCDYFKSFSFKERTIKPFVQTVNCDGTSILNVDVATNNGESKTYLWTGPGIVGSNTTQSITINQPGVYSVVVTFSSVDACQLTESIQVLKQYPFDLTLNYTQLNCFDYSVSFNIIKNYTTSTSTPTVVWYDPSNNIYSTANSITPNVNGIYRLVVTLDGCPREISFYYELPDFEAFIQPQSMQICEDQNISKVLKAYIKLKGVIKTSINDLNLYQFAWYKNVNGIFGFQGLGPTFQINSPGEYKVKVKCQGDPNSLEKEAVINVTAKTPDLVVHDLENRTTPFYLCSNSNVNPLRLQLAVNNFPYNYNVTWTKVGDLNYVPDYVFTDDQSLINVTQPGNYSVKITDEDGCEWIKNFEVQPGKIEVKGYERFSICWGEVVKLRPEVYKDGVLVSETELNNNFTIKWSPTDGLKNPNSLQPFASPDVTTSYKLIVTNSQGCSFEKDYMVNVFNKPTMDFIKNYEFVASQNNKNSSTDVSNIFQNTSRDCGFLLAGTLPCDYCTSYQAFFAHLDPNGNVLNSVSRKLPFDHIATKGYFLTENLVFNPVYDYAFESQGYYGLMYYKIGIIPAPNSIGLVVFNLDNQLNLVDQEVLAIDIKPAINQNQLIVNNSNKLVINENYKVGNIYKNLFIQLSKNYTILNSISMEFLQGNVLLDNPLSIDYGYNINNNLLYCMFEYTNQSNNKAIIVSKIRGDLDPNSNDLSIALSYPNYDLIPTSITYNEQGNCYYITCNLKNTSITKGVLITLDANFNLLNSNANVVENTNTNIKLLNAKTNKNLQLITLMGENNLSYNIKNVNLNNSNPLSGNYEGLIGQYFYYGVTDNVESHFIHPLSETGFKFGGVISSQTDFAKFNLASFWHNNNNSSFNNCIENKNYNGNEITISRFELTRNINNVTLSKYADLDPFNLETNNPEIATCHSVPRTDCFGDNLKVIVDFSSNQINDQCCYDISFKVQPNLTNLNYIRIIDNVTGTDLIGISTFNKDATLSFCIPKFDGVRSIQIEYYSSNNVNNLVCSRQIDLTCKCNCNDLKYTKDFEIYFQDKGNCCFDVFLKNNNKCLLNSPSIVVTLDQSIANKISSINVPGFNSNKNGSVITITPNSANSTINKLSTSVKIAEFCLNNADKKDKTKIDFKYEVKDVNGGICSYRSFTYDKICQTCCYQIEMNYQKFGNCPYQIQFSFNDVSCFSSVKIFGADNNNGTITYRGPSKDITKSAMMNYNGHYLTGLFRYTDCKLEYGNTVLYYNYKIEFYDSQGNFICTKYYNDVVVCNGYVAKIGFLDTLTPSTKSCCNKIQLMPNPVVEKLTIKLSTSERKHIDVKIYDLTGKLVTTVYSGMSSNELNLEADLKGISNGKYILLVESKDERDVNYFEIYK